MKISDRLLAALSRALPMVATIEKSWDGNERVTEGRNGRTYTSAGRWQWVVVVNGVADCAFDTKREAQARIEQLRSDSK
jgi:hypothetical protein